VAAWLAAWPGKVKTARRALAKAQRTLRISNSRIDVIVAEKQFKNSIIADHLGPLRELHATHPPTPASSASLAPHLPPLQRHVSLCSLVQRCQVNGKWIS